MHINNWLLQAGHRDLCQPMVAAATGAGDVARAWTLPYLKATKCKAGATIASSLLLSDSPRHRVWACDALAVIGSSKDLKKMTVLANTDAHSVLREHRRGGRIWATREYPVHAACRQAIGKIKLRAM